MEKGIVCVTGGNGFVASWLIKRLLEDGYYVNTTVRSRSDLKKDVSYLANLPKATENLKIFDVDINKPETFEAAIRGCIGVFHVAHPTLSNDRVEVLTEKTVKGALGILQACVDSKTVKKVVYTSSISTVMFKGKKHTKVIGEESWSDIDYINSHIDFIAWYHISKTISNS
ncbi:putative (3R)-2'-hydroxyisoflavanone reductase [Helianthus annuus]|nr:putative (3R)-2'-hydroxyisoflavanone reductase [Helianthus annuus]